MESCVQTRSLLLQLMGIKVSLSKYLWVFPLMAADYFMDNTKE